MEEKELTDEEIVKDIERSTGMPSYWKTIVLDLINRQQSEIERLTEERDVYLDDCSAIRHKLRQEIEEKFELQKQVDELKEERKNMQAEIIGLESQKEDLYFQNKNLQTYIDNHEPIWKRNTKKAVKDTAKEILDEVSKHYGGAWLVELYKRYGVEVE